MALLVTALHAVVLGSFLAFAPESDWRTVVSGVTWGGLSLAAARGAVQSDAASAPILQLLGDLEVSLFMVALFVSVLAGHLREANAQLRAALGDVRQLSALLRICAWCNKVRADDGQWERLERYLIERRIDVTHSICETCAAQVQRGIEPRKGLDPSRRISLEGSKRARKV